VALTGYRRRVREAARFLRWLAQGVVVVLALTAVVALVGLTLLMLMGPHLPLPESWDDSWSAVIATDVVLGVVGIVAIAVVVAIIDAVRVWCVRP
jgi:hypothetical protein